MAALIEPRVPELVELRHVRADDLAPILEEESLTWRSVLSWDFSASAELVRRFLKIQALSGFALMAGGRVLGYSYFVSEDRKALIGDLYVLRDFATAANEDLLLSAVLNSLLQTAYLRRIEAQLMMLHGPFDRALPYGRYLQTFPRNFMLADLESLDPLPPGPAVGHVQVIPWAEPRQDEAAHVIGAAYHGHVDSRINDQYQSVSGAQRFLTNIVQYPGCGSFFAPGSFLAVNERNRVCGVILASLVANDVGHITQVCVSPEVKHTGVGYELMRHALHAIKEHGCVKTSLTVTAANKNAIRLYQRMGFKATRRFAAYVWTGF
jgi:ribosomal protein S18 acetylase RimI-like enzyme